eukprot:gene21120-21910_t
MRRQFVSGFTGSAGTALVVTDGKSLLWTDGRIIDIRSAGVSHLDKIRAVQRFVVEKNAEGILVSMLDEIAWLFNVRGSDISFNPVTIAYAVITRDQAILFIDSVKITPEISAHLGAEVIIRPYEDIVNFVKQVVSVGPLLMDPSRVNWGVYLAAEEGDGSSSGSGVKVIDGVSPIALNKSRKNEAELAGIRACHIRDGVALTAFLHWLEVTVKNSQQQVTEFEVAEKLEEFRKRMLYHVGPSFSTIAGYGPNGAIIHYRPE